MQKAPKKAKKAYKTPKLATHGNVQKLTQDRHRKNKGGPQSGMFGNGQSGGNDD
jgi:hypothetical protein